MSDQDTSTTEAAAEDVQPATTDEQPTDLGEPGKKALREEREARKQAERELRDLRARIEDMEAAQNKTAEERAALEKQRDMERQAISKANERILKAEVRAAAASRLADPADALRFLDLTSFEVGDNGDVDSDAITSALDDLVNNKPYLAARSDQRFQGTADGGTRDGSRPKQITSREELARMSPAERLRAHDEGRLDKLLGVTA
jgi:TolA-binding protein